MLSVCYNNLIWIMYLDMSSSAVSSCSIRRNTWTCKAWGRQRTARVWGREQQGLVLTSSVIMVGQSEVRCCGDIRRSSTLKNRNTWAWRMGTWGRRRLSTRRSEEQDTGFNFIRKVVSDKRVCMCVCVLPCMSGRYFWYWSTSLL